MRSPILSRTATVGARRRGATPRVGSPCTAGPGRQIARIGAPPRLLVAQRGGGIVSIIVVDETQADQRRGKRMERKEAKLTLAQALGQTTLHYGATLQGGVDEASLWLQEQAKRTGEVRTRSKAPSATSCSNGSKDPAHVRPSITPNISNSKFKTILL